MDTNSYQHEESDWIAECCFGLCCLGEVFSPRFRLRKLFSCSSGITDAGNPCLINNTDKRIILSILSNIPGHTFYYINMECVLAVAQHCSFYGTVSKISSLLLRINEKVFKAISRT